MRCLHRRPAALGLSLGVETGGRSIRSALAFEVLAGSNMTEGSRVLMS